MAIETASEVRALLRAALRDLGGPGSRADVAPP
jgi:hypothetical protein